jgi:HAD superfamily hydrolase (TIGR01509 family)
LVKFIFNETLGYKFKADEGPSMIKAVIFDLDGTIVKFNIDFRAVRAEVRSFLISCGMPASILSLNESIFEMLKKAEIFMKNNGKPEGEMEGIRKKALKIAEKYEFEAAKTTILVPGVLEVLKALKDMGLKIGLCTVNGEKSVNHILQRFGIKELFDAVTNREHVKNVKPDTEHLKATLKALGVNPKEVLVVGDSITDMKCARALGAIAIGLLAGVSTPKELADAGANYLITSITDLPTLVKKATDVKA